MNRIACRTLLLPFALLSMRAAAATYEEGVELKRQQQLLRASTVFAEVAAREPGNVLAREQLAIVLGWQQRFDESIAVWQQAIALAPSKADYRIGLARVLYWKGARAESLQQLEAALQQQPENAEALKLQGDVLIAEGDYAAARSSYEQAQRLDPADTELATRILRAAPPLLWRLDAGFSYDHYSNARGNENSRFLQLGRRLGRAGDVVYARYDGYDNFGSIDQGFTLGAYWLPHPRLLLNLEAGRTLDDADFRPETQFLANGEWLLSGGFQPLLGFRYLDYDNGSVTTVTPGLRALLGKAALEVRYGLSDNVDGSSTGVFSARLGVSQVGYAPYFAFSTGKEALPPQAKASVTTVGAGVVVDLSTAWAIRGDYAYENRKNIYKHHTIGAALSYRF